jgi:hypothetical protein
MSEPRITTERRGHLFLIGLNLSSERWGRP